MNNADRQQSIKMFYEMLSDVDRVVINSFIGELSAGNPVTVPLNGLEHIYLGYYSEEVQKALHEIPGYVTNVVVSMKDGNISVRPEGIDAELKKVMEVVEEVDSVYIVCSCGYDQFYGRKDGTLECGSCGNIVEIPRS